MKKLIFILLVGLTGCMRPKSVPIAMTHEDRVAKEVERCGDAKMGARIWDQDGEQMVDCIPIGFQ